MKKRYLIAGASGLAGATLAGAAAAKLRRRPQDIPWEEHRERLHLAEYSRFAEVDGVRVHYQEAGERAAPPLLLIHGFCASTFVWSDVLLALAGMGFRVVAPDLVGFGFTGKPPEGEYTIEAQARMVVRLMDVLGLGRAALVGSSYGGAVAAVCALDFAERVERLVLVGAVTNDAARKQLLLRLAAAPLVGDVLSPLVLDSPRLMRWRLQKVYANVSDHLLEKRRMTVNYLPLRAANTQRAVLRTLRRWRAGRVEEEAHRITQPTLLVWGDRDRDIPLRYGEQLHARLPHARLVVFRNCGHLPQEEYPHEFAGLVGGFCKVVNGE